MDMSWASLRALKEVASRGTMIAAAEALGYTTGAISQQLAALETSVGTPLLQRVGRTVELTDAGVVLAKHAAELLEAQAHSRQAVRNTIQAAAGTVTLGVFATAAASLLTPIAEELNKQYPLIMLQAREYAVDDVGRRVRLSDVDLALGLDYPVAPIPREEGTKLRTLRSETFALAASPGSGLPDQVALSDLASHDWILPPANTHFGVVVRTVCRKVGFEPRATFEINDTAASLALAASGLGVCLVTPMMLEFSGSRKIKVSSLSESIQRNIVLIERLKDSYDRSAVLRTADSIAMTVNAQTGTG
ncbi:LysR family transcriptional regulator [Arthrobacter humicola]|uniref:LysR family transcriptional regulator n=1 Tax=Arthrobacter humicola TaxID=409291 RepID=UPI001FABA323|nr:LysR family transcriptional regulator [Arthrobacter humicola]MCI9870491.1 LysR family transcriptional regulator [Arthrobacter humicola]